MEGALGHAGENGDHRIDSIFLIHLRVTKNIHAIGRESTTEEGIDQVHLRDNIDEIQYFTKDEGEEVAVVVSIIKQQKH